MARIDYAPWGLIPPHSHPRATEILTVLEGRLLVGFVTSNPDNRLITKVLEKGDVQNTGVLLVANTLFGSTPSIPNDILAKAFQVDKSVVEKLQAQF
ncbi:putative germin-like protein 2-1 [Populus alba]|uniref:putative germin-like protein 2-1 n=1 Tax=Populus alba TaxID=43335 RepID=UPI003CC773B5